MKLFRSREIWRGKLKKVENLEMSTVGRGIWSAQGTLPPESSETQVAEITCFLLNCGEIYKHIETETIYGSGLQPSSRCDPSKQFLMLWRPPTIKLFFLLLHNLNFATVMNHNVNLCVFLMALDDPYERVI